MTIKEFIEKHLQNCEYGAELSKEAEQEAKENGFVVVFGASDDLCEFRGAVEDEVECFDGDNIYINAKGNIANTLFEDFAPDKHPEYKLIEAVWGNSGASWTYKTDIPHKTFTVTEDGEPYCIGIVFRLADCADKVTYYDLIKQMGIDELIEFIAALIFNYTNVMVSGLLETDECVLSEAELKTIIEGIKTTLTSEVLKSE